MYDQFMQIKPDIQALLEAEYEPRHGKIGRDYELYMEPKQPEAPT